MHYVPNINAYIMITRNFTVALHFICRMSHENWIQQIITQKWTAIYFVTSYFKIQSSTWVSNFFIFKVSSTESKLLLFNLDCFTLKFQNVSLRVVRKCLKPIDYYSRISSPHNCISRLPCKIILVLSFLFPSNDFAKLLLLPANVWPSQGWWYSHRLRRPLRSSVLLGWIELPAKVPTRSERLP